MTTIDSATGWCEICKTLYSPDFPADRRLHSQLHDEYVNGVKWPGYKNENILYFKGESRIVRIDDWSKQCMRNRAAKVGRRGNSETEYDCGIYSSSELGPILLIGIIKQRAISILVLREINEIWAGNWEDIKPGPVPDNEITQVYGMLGCSYYWMLKNYRGTKMVKKMIECAETIACNSNKTLPLRPPLTKLGENFFKKCYPTNVTFFLS